ncbi:MAG: sialidase family protein [Actinomycetota bacterium]
MRARIMLAALLLLAVFAATGLASATFGLQGLAGSGVTSSVNGEVLSPVGGAMSGRELGAGAGNATAPVNVALPARVVDYAPTVPTTTRTFLTTDFTDPVAGPRAATTDWRVVGGTGNAAELWFTIASTGRILDLGGRYVIFSDDQGLTWKAVKPQEELVNAEGSVVEAPNGDIVAITWDPYTGDRVLTYKYTKATNAWTYMYMPQHTPFWDRPTIETIHGPFTDQFGDQVPYLTFTQGFPHDPWQYSYDGLNYTGVSSKSRDRGPAVSFWLDVLPDPARDHTQILTDGLFPTWAALDSGKAWSGNLIFDRADMKWHPWTTPDGDTIDGKLQIDSRGWLHNLQGSIYRTSVDGGRTWNELELPQANPGDFKANGAAGIAAVVAEKSTPKGVQDQVFKIDISTPQPKLLYHFLVGDGDDGRISGAGAYTMQGGHRFDFSNVAIFDDGRLAVTFMDKKTRIPVPTLGENPVACAIEDQPDGPGELGSPCRVVAPMLAIEQATTISG